MPYGNFYYGKGGFQFKKMTGGGARRNFAIGAICNQPQDIYNSYVPGAGVGGTSIATRRAKLIRATKCYNGHKCGRFFTYLGIKPQQQITSLDIISEIEEVQPKPPQIYYNINLPPNIGRAGDSNYPGYQLVSNNNGLKQEVFVSDNNLPEFQNIKNYITSSSSVINEYAYQAFVNELGGPPDWHSATYYTTGGVYNGSNNTLVNGTQVLGEWLQIELPYPLILKQYSVGYRANYPGDSPKSWVIAGSNTGIDDWKQLDDTTYDITVSPTITTFPTNGSNLTNTIPYTFFRIIVTSVDGNQSNFTSSVQMTMQLNGNVVIYPSV